MTKRLFGVVKGHREHIADHTGRLYSDSEVADLLNTVHEENEQLKTQLQNTSDQRDEFHRGARENANRVGKLKKENEQLKQRNNRQAKQLDNLYHLIEKQDWKTLNGLIQEFQECEEQLQREWRTYE